MPAFIVRVLLDGMAAIVPAADSGPAKVTSVTKAVDTRGYCPEHTFGGRPAGAAVWIREALVLALLHGGFVPGCGLPHALRQGGRDSLLIEERPDQTALVLILLQALEC